MSAQAIGLYVSNNGIVGGNLTVVGNMAYKPYIAFRLSANAIAQNTGQVSTAKIAITRASGGGGLYTFTFPAHPNDIDYLVITQSYTAGTANSVFTCTASHSLSTAFSVWCRTTANVVGDGNFYVFTVP